MKADKILFVMACLGMGYLTYSAANQSSCQGEHYNTALLSDTVNKNAVSHELAKDTVSFSKAAKDSAKMIQKIVK